MAFATILWRMIQIGWIRDQIPMRGGQGSLSTIPCVTFSATKFMILADPLYTPMTIQTASTIQMLSLSKNIFNLETGVAVYLFNK
jgi:hypothetical protein